MPDSVVPWKEIRFVMVALHDGMPSAGNTYVGPDQQADKCIEKRLEKTHMRRAMIQKTP